MAHGQAVTVEFFGIPRQRAGRAELVVQARTVTKSLAAVERDCPGLAGLRQEDGRLARHFLLSINGERFVTDPEQLLRHSERLLLLLADAGG